MRARDLERLLLEGHREKLIDNLLLSPTPEDILTPPKGKRRLPRGTQAPAPLPAVYDPLSETLLDNEPKELESDSALSFEPRFNIREEFATWMEKHYPTKGVADWQRRIYNNRHVIYPAALLACEHGEKTTNTCVQSQFRGITRELRGWHDDEYQFPKIVNSLVRTIQELAENLGGRHYGTTYKRTGRALR